MGEERGTQRSGVAERFHPASQDDLAPSGAKARYNANIAAIHLSHVLGVENRHATGAEQQVLARWSGWGAVADVFDESKENWAAERAELKVLLSESEYAEARKTTMNAHYTDPAYVSEIWSAIGELGFTGGDVLEPGSGAGTFIGLAPAGAQMTGVELDSTTARISAGLYPQATILAESFVDTRFPRGHFDASVGNVPFGDFALHDPLHNSGGHSIHNHFILKTLDLTRPGGLVAVLTSRYTLDAQNPAARREMNGMADLVGAVRLPSGAHRRAAGTEVVTDLLIFRKREPGVPPTSLQWETVTAHKINDTVTKINSYFDSRPENILGELRVGTGMFGNETLDVIAPSLDGVAAALRGALEGVVVDARERSQTMTPRSASSVEQRASYRPAAAHVWDGTIAPEGKDAFTVVKAGQLTPFKVPKNAAAELRALLGIRDRQLSLVEIENSTTEDTTELDASRTNLKNGWNSYVARYGPINRFSLRPTGRVDPESGEPTFARTVPAAIRALRSDPHGPRVMALERFDEETQQAKPAAILERRVLAPRAVKKGAETPVEAVALSLDRTGGVELETVAHLLGIGADEARAALGELVYDDPTTGDPVHAPEYLSGDVREKLDLARAAAQEGPDRYTVNVRALEAVLPPRITGDQIQARMGAVWISPEVHQDFLREILRDRTVTVTNPLPAEWEVKGNRQSLRATSEWGTTRRSAIELAKSLMEQSQIKVDDEYNDGEKTRRIVNPTETTAAQEKADSLQERFGEWVWEQPERAEKLANEYNHRFNSIVLRDYTAEGAFLTMPGVAENFSPRPHQRAAVARMISEPAVGLFHQVGAGKTAEMVIGTMELKRMGLVNKPVVVVPNHMLEQFGREWLQIHPRAMILAASSDDLAGDKRRLFVARIAANDWDAVIMTRTAYQRLPLSPESEAKFIDTELVSLRAALETNQGEGSKQTVKKIEKAIAKAAERQKKLLDTPRDPGITFEATGIDYVVVDEMHDYKNLNTVSRIPDANIEGASRATDMLMKLEYLRGKHGRRVATVATATPLANSVTEAHVMQRYLRPDLLEKAGVLHFDAWAATFGKTITETEMAPTGGGSFRMKTRFAGFQNVPEMLRMWHVFADVKTAEDLNLPTPALRRRADGTRQPENQVLLPSPELTDYITQIGERAEAVAQRRVEPTEDNMLKISTDGRKAALDMRLVDPFSSPSYSKIDSVTANIANIWAENRDRSYVDPETGEPHPVQGALQIVFCDLGTPNPTRWNAYDEIKLKLVDKGLPAESIRFIHEAKSDGEKARLFAAARSGHVAVLLGSTQKMGVGTNVQARAVALHHVDCPWRPADIEQRDGRILRQGNQNPEIGIYRYVVEGSFDGYMWESVARKARFIAQVMRGKLDVREIEDIGDSALSAAETKALASGNPLLLEQSVAANDAAKLERLERAWHRNQSNLTATRASSEQRITSLEAQLEQLAAALPHVVDTSEDKFTMTVAARRYDQRVDAGHAIGQWAAEQGIRYLPTYRDSKVGSLGTIGGFTVDVFARSTGSTVLVEASLRDVPGASVSLPREQFAEAGIGLVRQLENRAASIPKLIQEAEQRLQDAQTNVAEAEASIGAPFKYFAELEVAQKRLIDVNAQIVQLSRSQDDASERSETPEAATPPPTRNLHSPAPAPAPVRRRAPHPYTGPVTGPSTPTSGGLSR